jgi:hypothetical protein
MKVADKTISSSGNLTVSLRFTGTENYSKKANQSLYDAIIKESGDLFQKVDWGKEGYVTVEIKNQAGEFKNLLD